jgi:GH15 family glucan-1,4-alpha-glucosidase
MTARGRGYLPIEDYGAIGNLRTAALVGRNGSIDWCCLPRFDSPSVFAAILDRRKGGHFRVSAIGSDLGTQRYLDGTNVLRTSFSSSGGVLHVTDWMPLRGELEGCGQSEGLPEVHRLLECEGAPVEVLVEWAPRFDYARGKSDVTLTRDGAAAESGDDVLYLTGLPVGGEIVDFDGPLVRARFKMEEGQRVALATRWGRDERRAGPDAAGVLLEETTRSWSGWLRRGETASRGGWAGPWQDLVARSALALKLLIHADTGSIIAAPTTSLPEEIGGMRNWDYRYSWIRDATQTVEALFAVGHRADARDYLHWVEKTAREGGRDELDVQLMYSLDGNYALEEDELDHLEGYRGSRPVRIGNAAADQLQLDTYGELLGGAYDLLRTGEELREGIPEFVCRLADRACEMWHNPDNGIWEARMPKRHYVHSKVMVWVALDRAIHLANEYGLPGDPQRWTQSADNVRQTVLERGFDRELNSFVWAFGTKDLDAANLLIPMQEFLPASDPRVQGTIDRTLEQLTVNGLVYRYKGDDGLPGEEGAFGLCTFWMVDALALSKRLDEAYEIFEGMVGRANHLGLYSEEIDPDSGEFLGNFPQAFTHIGLINSALYLARAEGREIPAPDLVGTGDHRSDDDEE